MKAIFGIGCVLWAAGALIQAANHGVTTGFWLRVGASAGLGIACVLTRPKSR